MVISLLFETMHTSPVTTVSVAELPNESEPSSGDLSVMSRPNRMVSTGRLPQATAPVMSKVGFNLIIPCMLMSKVALTLTAEASWALAGIPLAAFLQIAVGASRCVRKD